MCGGGGGGGGVTERSYVLLYNPSRRKVSLYQCSITIYSVQYEIIPLIIENREVSKKDSMSRFQVLYQKHSKIHIFLELQFKIVLE